MKVYEKKPLSILQSFEKVDSRKVDIQLKEALKGFKKKIIVLDDDPTGVQTVHNISVYTDWDEDTIRAGFAETNNMFFLLTNSRSFSKEETARIHKDIANKVCKVSEETGLDFVLISRGDSTLRGHYPLETETLAAEIKQNRGYDIDGEIICPFFMEGGRYTFGNIHYVKEGDALIPAGMTEFAWDKTFGYESSSLPEYIEEKTKKAYEANSCITISIEELRNFQIENIYEKLMAAKEFNKIIVNAIDYVDLKIFCIAFLKAIQGGKHFLARTAAAFPKVLAGIDEIPLLVKEDLVKLGNKIGGIVLIGSHVKKTTLQLQSLMESEEELCFIEFDVNSYFKAGGLEREVNRTVSEVEQLIKKGNTCIIYTSRKLLVPDTCDKDQILKVSVKISEAVTSIIGKLETKPSFIVAKGGITSSDVGTKALKVKKALVMGQIKKGIPVWMTGAESKFPGMPYIIFPGNVGEVTTLREIIEELVD